jgi:hypothetical protein
MQPIQLELIKRFTTEEERNDAHTSACAMLRDFIEQMDIDSVKLMFIDSDIYAQDVFEAEAFFKKLEKAFLFMRIEGNIVLESAEARCNHCHPGVASYIFKGKSNPWHISFLFHVENHKVVDIHECFQLWTKFPELEIEMQLRLDEGEYFYNDIDGGMDDPPF